MESTTTTKRHVTPRGLLVLSADAPRTEWLGERKNGITATDLPAILGLNKYKTAIDVWMSKINPDDDSFEPSIGNMEAAFWGIELEDIVARKWAEHVGVDIRRVGIIEHDENAWMRASLDRLVTGCPDGRCALEVKTRSTYKADDWDAGVPAEERAQVEWQLLVSGLDHIHIIALIGGQRLVQHRVESHEINADRLIIPAATVWESVRTGDAPKLSADLWTNEYLEQLHTDRSGEIEIGNALSETIDAYNATIELIKDLETRKAELRTELVGALGEYEVATTNGRTAYTYKASTTRRLDPKALAELYPAVVADDRVWNESTSRTLRVTTTKKGN